VSQYATREDFARSVRQQIVSTARAMLEGRLSFLLGSRVLAPLRPQSEATRYDQDFLIFVAISSQTNALPLDTVPNDWDQHILTRLEPEIQGAERWASTVGADACRSLIARFSERGRNI
jgi:hypothetical protein